MADLKSWNLWHGCTKYSEGCANCYMYALDKIRKVPERSSVIVRTGSFRKPLGKDRHGRYKIPAGYCLRVNMTSDTFLEEADPWRNEMWEIIRSRPDVRFFLLTKRVPRIAEHLPDDWGDGYENVELNITCENQRAFDERWSLFERIPAKHKGMNLAPLIGSIDITPALASGQIENVSLGGESFGGRRPCHYDWVKQISDDCRKFRVNFTFNSTGAVFVKNGRTFHLELAQVQAKQAYRSGLSHFFNRIEYKLYSPYDGHRLSAEELLKPVYNVHRCTECTSLETCIGCVDCGSCKEISLVGYDEIISLRK